MTTHDAAEKWDAAQKKVSQRFNVWAITSDKKDVGRASALRSVSRPRG
jgi:hypothetical protein